MSDSIKNRNTLTELDLLVQVGALFAGDSLFFSGFGAGVESETWHGRHSNRVVDSPITLLTQMPSWEGSNRLRGCEQDFRYSIGAVVGAFATRSGMDTDALYEQLFAMQPGVSELGENS